METNKKNHIEVVKFNDAQIICVMIKGEPHVLVNSIIDNIGLNDKTARETINEKFKSHAALWRCGSVNFPNPHRPNLGLNPGTTYLTLPVRKIAAWLYSISPNKVSEKTREKLIAFQEHCDDVLYEHFFGGMGAAKGRGSYFERKSSLLDDKLIYEKELKNVRTELAQLPLVAKERNLRKLLKNTRDQLTALEQEYFDGVLPFTPSPEHKEGEYVNPVSHLINSVPNENVEF